MARPRKVAVTPDAVSIRIVWSHVGIAHLQKALLGEEVSVPQDVAAMLVEKGAAVYA